MKKVAGLIFIPLIALSLSSIASYMVPSAHAQAKPECSDTKDNDSDGKIDAADPECVAGKTCENGATTCTAGAATTVTGSQSSDFNLKIKLNNPLKVNTIQGAIKVFMDAVVKIAIPFIIVFFIWSGLQFILARGNPDGLKKAKAMFWSTVIGALLILGAWTITNAIVGTINSIAS